MHATNRLQNTYVTQYLGCNSVDVLLWQQQASVAVDAGLSDDKLWICRELVKSGGSHFKILWLYNVMRGKRVAQCFNEEWQSERVKGYLEKTEGELADGQGQGYFVSGHRHL